MNKITLIIAGGVIVVLAIILVFVTGRPADQKDTEIVTIEEIEVQKQQELQDHRFETATIDKSEESEVYLIKPEELDSISSPLEIEGIASSSLFEQGLKVFLRDSDGAVLAEANLQMSDWNKDGLYGFETELKYLTEAKEGFIEIFSIEGLLEVPILFD